MAQNGSYRNIGGKQWLLRPRDYIVAIAHSGVANATASGFITVDPSAPFLLREIYAYDTNDPSLAAPGLMGQYENLMQIVDNSQNYTWQNQVEPRSALCGSREWNRVLPDECLINANTKFTVVTQEPAASPSAGTTYVVLQGYSLYPAA